MTSRQEAGTCTEGRDLILGKKGGRNDPHRLLDCSTALFKTWHRLHKACRLVSALVPPFQSGSMWSNGFCKMRSAIFGLPPRASSPAVKCMGASVGSSQLWQRLGAAPFVRRIRKGSGYGVARDTLYVDSRDKLSKRPIRR